MSLPVRERGLKSLAAVWQGLCGPVAPCAGAWIEISGHKRPASYRAVAPCAGAWIEIL